MYTVIESKGPSMSPQSLPLDLTFSQSIQHTSSQYVSVRRILTLFSHLHLWLQSDFLTLEFPLLYKGETLTNSIVLCISMSLMESETVDSEVFTQHSSCVKSVHNNNLVLLQTHLARLHQSSLSS